MWDFIAWSIWRGRGNRRWFPDSVVAVGSSAVLEGCTDPLGLRRPGIRVSEGGSDLGARQRVRARQNLEPNIAVLVLVGSAPRILSPMSLDTRLRRRSTAARKASCSPRMGPETTPDPAMSPHCRGSPPFTLPIERRIGGRDDDRTGDGIAPLGGRLRASEDLDLCDVPERRDAENELVVGYGPTIDLRESPRPGPAKECRQILQERPGGVWPRMAGPCPPLPSWTFGTISRIWSRRSGAAIVSRSRAVTTVTLDGVSRKVRDTRSPVTTISRADVSFSDASSACSASTREQRNEYQHRHEPPSSRRAEYLHRLLPEA